MNDDDATTPPDPTARILPQWTPNPREFDDLDLIVTQSLWPPLAGFVDPQTADDHDYVTLVVDGPVADEVLAARELELVDPEGAPLARLTLAGTWPAGRDRTGLVGPVQPLTHSEFGPFRRLHRSPADIHAEHPADALLAVAVRHPLTTADLERISRRADESGRTVLLIACMGEDMPRGVSGPALVRATRAAAGQIQAPTLVIATSAADHGDEGVNERLLESICRAFASETLVLQPADGAPLPAAVDEIVRRDRPPRDQQGAVIFFTGLSGSGKSTLARALTDRILERGDRTITSLDGDVVRHHLSKGLGFSREDRETNILRIGFVAAEIARHGGFAICSPIAPFESTRAAVRRMVERAGGGFVLIHVATPLAECERRDRKGLYAKARAGLIPDFTGISAPYEEPINALKIDTTDRDILECCEEILEVLTIEGWLHP